MANNKAAPAMMSFAMTAKSRPQKGDHYRCERCGMEIEVTAPCGCAEEEEVVLACCGKDMVKV